MGLFANRDALGRLSHKFSDMRLLFALGISSVVPYENLIGSLEVVFQQAERPVVSLNHLLIRHSVTALELSLPYSLDVDSRVFCRDEENSHGIAQILGFLDELDLARVRAYGLKPKSDSLGK